MYISLLNSSIILYVYYNLTSFINFGVLFGLDEAEKKGKQYWNFEFD